jgi:bifunctional diaminopimelate decarboxylase / aspartate kinase
MINNNFPCWAVIKFGGTSVSSLSNWNNIAAVIRRHMEQSRHLLIVCSAASQISNKLEQLIGAAILGDYELLLDDIVTSYQTLAKELELNFDRIVLGDVIQLRRLIEGVVLLGEVSPKIQAQILAFGELAVTKLGAEFLKRSGINVAWQDARHHLKSADDRTHDRTKSYIQAYCDFEKDTELKQRFEEMPSTVLLTQGFIASNSRQETVLLGRGGSDTSAAYFAAKLQAEICEIWTDVPGVYTANPQVIPQARFLDVLDYDEAQEIAAMGANVLNPNCIQPLKYHQIPLYVKYTADPKREGTKISLQNDGEASQIKSILTKSDILLIAIESIRMWQQVGFLSAIFECFNKHNVSIDLITTSESSVTVSLDQTLELKDPEILTNLLDDLNLFSNATVIGPCASISLVGRNIRSILSKLGHTFEVFSSHNIYLLSQASNDLNLTFVVDEEQVLRLLQRLHILLIEENASNACFNRSWQEEFGQRQKHDNIWWQMDQKKLLQLMQGRDSSYVYSATALKQAATDLINCDALDQCFYAMKANPNPDILTLFHQMGVGFECVSLGEVNHVLTLFPDIDRHRILFTPNFSPRDEYEAALSFGIHVTVDSLYPLQHWSDLFKGKDILVRIDLGQGDGHHRYVCTAGSDSKFGIPLAEIDQLVQLSSHHQIRIIGLHSHSGSGILNADSWSATARSLSNLTKQFQDVSIINVGGGLGIAERQGQQSLDMVAVNDSLMSIKDSIDGVRLWMEPGRFLVARAGVLLARVTQIKDKGGIRFIGVATGMNSLIRPALYGSYHEIINLSKLDQPNVQVANIVGPICETGDTLGYSRLLPETEEGDILLIVNTGAYGRAMSSHYNLRDPAPEIMLA